LAILGKENPERKLEIRAILTESVKGAKVSENIEKNWDSLDGVSSGIRAGKRKKAHGDL